MHQRSGDPFWAPRLVLTDGATVTAVCEGVRVRAPALAPDGLSPYHWQSLEITVAQSSTRTRLVGHVISSAG